MVSEPSEMKPNPGGPDFAHHVIYSIMILYSLFPYCVVIC